MSGFWYLPILEKMEPEELQALIDLVYAPENEYARTRITRTCDTREEAAIVAKRCFGLEYDRENKRLVQVHRKKVPPAAKSDS